MAATSRAWGVCRTLAVRSRPIVSNRTPFLATAPQRRGYANKTNDGKLPKRVDQSHTEGTTEPVPPESAAQGVQDALGERMSDEELHQVLYGGRIEPQEGDEGLTKEQEEVLYQTGRIPSKAEAEQKAHEMGIEGGEELAGGSTEQVALSPEEQALREKDFTHPERGTWGGREFKFALPPRPYPANFNHKKRYHPVVDLLVRMMMRDGKLSPAQRVRAVSTGCTIQDTDLRAAFSSRHELPSNIASADLQPKVPASTRHAPPFASPTEPNPLPHRGRRLSCTATEGEASRRCSWWWPSSRCPGAATATNTPQTRLPMDPRCGGQKAVKGQWPQPIWSTTRRGDHCSR